jgi:hypothetical protein
VYIVEFCFCGKFSPPNDKKKGLVNPTKGVLIIEKNNFPYLKKKRLEVAKI